SLENVAGEQGAVARGRGGVRLLQHFGPLEQLIERLSAAFRRGGDGPGDEADQIVADAEIVHAGSADALQARQRPSTSSFFSPLALRWAMQSSNHWRALAAASWAARPTAGSFVRSVKRYWKMVLPHSANSRSEGGTVPKYPAIQRAGTTRLNWLTSSSLPPDCDTSCSAVFATNPAMAPMSCRRITLRICATSRSYSGDFCMPRKKSWPPVMTLIFGP